MKRSPLSRRTPLKRSPFRKRSRPKAAHAIQSEIWRYDLGPCRICPAEGHGCNGQVDGHHAVTRQALRKRGLGEFEWDNRNRVAVCRGRHEAHHNRARPISLSLLPDAVHVFAAELGLTHLLERTYVTDEL